MTVRTSEHNNRDEHIIHYERWCYTGRFATTIYSATHAALITVQHCCDIFRMVTTLFQHCNAVLRGKSSLQIVSCNITLMTGCTMITQSGSLHSQSQSIKQNSSLPHFSYWSWENCTKRQNCYFFDKIVICFRVTWTSFVQYWVRLK